MCKICGDDELKEKVNDLYNKINERIKATKRNEEERKEAFAFSTTFPLIDFVIFEPRMGLQIPSNFYQPTIVDGKKLRSDWTSGWMRCFGFKDNNLYLLMHAFKKKEEQEYLIYLYMVEFSPGEYSVKEEGSSITIEVKDVKKGGIDLINDKRIVCNFSFSFVHKMTESSIVRREQAEALIKRVYGDKITQKPVVFDFSEYVITQPHFAFHPFIHRNFSKYGYKSALEMQKDVVKILKEHL
jgi:hypothetical protein